MADYATAKIVFGGTEKTLLDLVKELSGIPPLDTARDAEFSMYLQMAGESAQRYTNNALAKRQVVEQLSHSGSPVLLNYFPFVDGLLVMVDGQDVTADYELFHQNGMARIASSRCEAVSSCCFDQMVITYNAGFDPLPADLGYAIARTAMAYEQQASGGGQLKKESIVGVGSWEFSTADEQPAGFGMFSAASLSILDQYRSLAI